MEPEPFKTLKEAIEFLAVNLDANNIEAIAARCLNSSQDDERIIAGLPHPHEYRAKAIQLLRGRHRTFSLRWRYVWRRFPRRANEFKLGGHAHGHIHLDFVRSGESWLLKDIWMCR